MTKRNAIVVTSVALAMLGAPGLITADDDGEGRSLKASLTGFQEPPSVSTTGRGKFKAKISSDESSFEYELSYRDLEGTITQSHIHIGQFRVNGGIAIWLCQTEGTLAPEPVRAVTPVCPGPNEGTVTGTVTAAQVLGPGAQGFAAGDFERLVRAMRAGVAYANVHSDRNPGGEIRGQIRKRDRDGDD